MKMSTTPPKNVPHPYELGLHLCSMKIGPSRKDLGYYVWSVKFIDVDVIKSELIKVWQRKQSIEQAINRLSMMGFDPDPKWCNTLAKQTIIQAGGVNPAPFRSKWTSPFSP